MKSKTIIVTAILIVAAGMQNLFAWGGLEHDAITYIAECNLKPDVKKRVESYLDGRSIVYYASWMDDYRKTPEFLFSDSWHMSYVDENFKFMEAPDDKSTYRCVPALEDAIKQLENYKSLDDSTVAVALKFLIHLTADMHCPGHVNYHNREIFFQVKYNGTDVGYHQLWDAYMLRSSHTWSYSEYQFQLDRCSEEEKKQIMQGTPRDWFEQTARDCDIIYKWAHPGDSLGVDFKNKAHFLGESQMLKAGYRIAYLLNTLFDK